MAIRMVQDENQPQQQRKLPGNGGGNRGGGGGGNIITMLLPLLMGLFRKNPKMGCGVLIVGAVVLYFFGGSLFNGGGGGTTNITDLFNTGASFDAAKYDATEIFEPPITDNAKNPLPEAISLLEYAPDRKNQGSQGSCVGWGSAYAARTILEAQRTGRDPNQIAFSPLIYTIKLGWKVVRVHILIMQWMS
jgi:hypothetical protein